MPEVTLEAMIRRSRDCQVCGKAFEPHRAGAQYCSDACRQRAYRRRVTDNEVRVTDQGRVTDSRVTDNQTVVPSNDPAPEARPPDPVPAEQIEPPPISAPEPVPSAETARTPPSVTDRSSEAVGSRRCAVCGDDLYRCFPLKCPLKSASNSVAEGV